ncbi:MAG: sigma-70 family RNA polymerase sigma factor [Jatrophihabitans endophyticus]|nr:sigma-70 family RNA polymerase sigma factor [Jatrophihabitans endophyticus]
MTATVREQWMPLVRLATLLLNDRAVAEEVVQEACEAVWRRRPDVASRGQLTAYLRTAVVNGSRSVGRRRGTAARHLSLLRAEHDAVDEPADAALLVREDRREIRAAVSRLPDRQREVLVLRYWARLSEADIAHTLDISPGTVKSTAHHALAALRAHLKGQS